jgi:hypothetical protein
LHADLRLHLDASADDVVLDSAKGSLGKVRITYKLTGAVTQHPNAAANLTISGRCLTDPIRRKPVVLRSRIGALQILVPRPCFFQFATETADSPKTQESH